MRDTPESQDTLAARIAGPLKGSERANATFADRVMHAVRAEARGKRQGTDPGASSSWWRRSVTVSVSPLSGLALAAGLATVVLGGARLLSMGERSASAPQSVAARSDTVHVVRFVFVAPGASTVALAGDFNRWDVNAHQLRPVGADGVWSASVALTPGRHEYAFVIDGTRWVADPVAATTIADEFGGQSSVVTVGGPRRPRSS
jgi:hypothetical protein